MKKSLKSKIIAVHLLNDRSGSPMVFARALQCLANEGYEVDLYSSGYDLPGFLNEVAGIKKIVNPYSWSSNPLMTLIKYTFNQVYLFFVCFRYWGKDVSFYLNTYLPFGAALAAFVMRKPVVYHIHETSIKPAILKRFLKAVVKLTAQQRIYVSKFLLEEEGWSTSHNQEVIYNYAHPELAEKSLDFHAQWSERSTILMLASLKDYKGVPQFIELAKLSPKLNFELVLNAAETEVNAYLEELELPANLACYPVQTKLDKFYKDAQVLLNLSQPKGWVETFGLTILEAMHYGIPTVVPQVGGPLELVKNQVSGFTVNTESVSEVKKAIEQILIDRETYQHFSTASKAQSKVFSRVQSEARLLEIFSIS